MFLVVLVAQVVTVAALSRATFLVFFRRRLEPYENLARRRPGMLAALLLLSAGCVAFGLLPGTLLDHVVSPAAASLLHPHQYAATARRGARRADTDPDLLQLSVGRRAAHDHRHAHRRAGVGLVVRPPARTSVDESSPGVHTGSVNDYAAYAVLGTVMTLTAVLLF
jgi:multicomponent Na+:H+ antiporter subunit D